MTLRTGLGVRLLPALVAVVLSLALAGTSANGQAPSPTPTVLPVREWTVDSVSVEGSTVTVKVRVFAGIGLETTLDGRQPDQTAENLPLLVFVFLNVSAGTHEVKVKDIVGFAEAVTVVVPAAEIPEALLAAIRAEVVRRGYAYAGLCKDVPDDGQGVGKHCAVVSNLTESSADIAFAPYATDQFTTLRMVLRDGEWRVAAPTPPSTGTGVRNRVAGYEAGALLAAAVIATGAWLLARRDKPGYRR